MSCAEEKQKGKLKGTKAKRDISLWICAFAFDGAYRNTILFETLFYR